MLVMIFVALILIALVVWAVPQLMAAIGVPANVATVVNVGLVVLIVIVSRSGKTRAPRRRRYTRPRPRYGQTPHP